MAVAVDSNGVSLCRDSFCNIGVFPDIFSHHEEGSSYIPGFQHIQHRTGIFSRRTVVKGEIHGFGIKIQINAFGNAPCQFFLVLRVCQPFSFTGIRQKPRLDQT